MGTRQAPKRAARATTARTAASTGGAARAQKVLANGRSEGTGGRAFSRESGGRAKVHSSEPSERVNPKLRALLVPIKALKHDPDNARAHDDKSIAAIRASLTRFGQQKPVVTTADGVVVAGNGMLAAARALGWRKLAALPFPSTDVNEVRAYALADNRTAELSRWDHEQLGALLAGLRAVNVPVVDLGWTAQELEMLTQADFTPAEPEEDGLRHEQGAHSIRLTADQFAVCNAAMSKVREREGDPAIPDGRCLELICADFIA